MKHSNKEKKKSYKIIYICMLVLAVGLIGVLVYALYQFGSEYIPQQKEAGRYEELRSLIQPADDSAETDDGDAEPTGPVPTTSDGNPLKNYSLDRLFSMNGDMVAWLEIPDTLIDYPVMHTPGDVEYYLHTDFDGYYSFSGCLFVGDNCDIDSDIFVVYGHNMNNGTMFGQLDWFGDYGYCSSHRDVILRTREGTRLYRVFAAFPTKVYEEDEETDDFRYYNSVGEKSKEEYDKITDQIAEISYVDFDEKPSYPAQIIYLSTCAYHEENGRFVVAAYRIY